MTDFRAPLTRTFSLLFVLSLFALAAMPATAQTGFLKIDDIEGESRSSDHNRWIEILSVSHDWESPNTGSAGQSRRRSPVVYSDMVIVKEIDASTPLLMNAVALGRRVPSALIDVMRGGSVLLKYELKNVAITSHSVQEGKEQISLSFESIKIIHPSSGREVEVRASQ